MATNSIVDLLKSQGKDSSYAARKKMAESMGIKNCSGTAAQNIQMLNFLQSKPTTTTPVKAPIITPVKTPTIPTQAEINAQADKVNALIAGKNTKKADPINEVSATSTDPIIQKYKDRFNEAKAGSDTAGMIAAADAADNYRVSKGGNAQNVQTISNLKSKLTPENSLNSATNELLSGLGKVQNFDDTYRPKETEEEYMSEITQKINAMLEEQKRTSVANAEKAKRGILTDADIAKQEMNDAYSQQLQELSSQADKIRSAYTSGKRGIETTRDQTLPTFDRAMNQQDVLAQREKKQLEGEFAQRGLQSGGQLTSELGQLGQENLSKIGDISTGKQNYISDTSNKLADLEQTQTSGLSDLARAESTAAQTLSTGKTNIIKKVNAALSNLNTDEQALLDNLASQRTQMLFESGRDYKNLSQKEKDAEFDRQLKATGVAQDAVQTIRRLIDDINKSKMVVLESQVKELELKGLPKQLEQEAKLLQQEVDKGDIEYDIAKQELNNLKNGLTRSGGQPSGTSKETSMKASDYKTNPDFADDLAYASTTDGALNEIKSIAADLIRKYGVDGYNTLLKAATPTGG